MAAAAIAGLAVIAELLPVLFGTGADAKIDWSFSYVTLRFILLPLSSLILIACIAVGLIGLGSARERLLSASAMLVPAGYLVLSWLHPTFFFVPPPP